MGDLARVALLDRDRRRRRRASSRSSARAARHRTARRCRAPPAPSDRCRSCWRRRRPRSCGRCRRCTDRPVPWRIRWPPALSTMTVCGTPCCAELPGGEAGALVARPGLVDPDMHRDARIVGAVDRRQRGAPIDRRQPAGIAMGQDLDATGLPPLAPLRLGDQRQAVLADRAALIATSSSAISAARASAASRAGGAAAAATAPGASRSSAQRRLTAVGPGRRKDLDRRARARDPTDRPQQRAPRRRPPSRRSAARRAPACRGSPAPRRRACAAAAIDQLVRQQASDR